MNIEDWRNQIDQIDAELVQLLNRRAACSVEIGRLKHRMNLNIVSRERGDEIIGCALKYNQGPLNEDAIRRLFAAILEESRRLQAMAAEQTSASFFEMTAAAITSEDESAGELIGRDLSPQKNRHEQMVQSEKLAAVGRFMSSVAHELNNPLTVIAGFAEILLGNLKLNEPDQADLQMIASEANRARHMIYDLLALSRTPPHQKQLLDLNQLVALTLEQHHADLQANRIEVITELAADMPLLSADPDQLKEVFTHIIHYIRKSLSTGRDGGRLRVRTAVRPDKAGAESSPVACITMADDGPNRSSDDRRQIDDLHQIFEPSFSTREPDQGLGLALAYNLIHQHGGQMSAVRGPEGGVRFIIELPVKEAVSHQLE